tara:strand:- start:134 stop:451 length:318 start_codon:yes stop_codon:yes gene_type:complete
MKKTLVLIGLFCAVNVQADGLFGAALKPNPSVTLFGQKLTWPIPSLCVGAKAGVTPNADVSAEGINLKIPYLSVEIPFPSLLLKAGKDNPAIEVKLGAISKQDAK